MNKQINIPLTLTLPTGDIDQIRLFQAQFSELWSNWESLQNSGISLGEDFQNNG